MKGNFFSRGSLAAALSLLALSYSYAQSMRIPVQAGFSTGMTDQLSNVSQPLLSDISHSIGQTFTAENSGALTTIQFYVSDVLHPGGYRLSIYSCNAEDDFTTLLGTLSGLSITAIGWNKVDVSGLNIPVRSGDMYGFKIIPSEGLNVNIKADYFNSYFGGKEYFFQESSVGTISKGGTDLVFQIDDGICNTAPSVLNLIGDLLVVSGGGSGGSGFGGGGGGGSVKYFSNISLPLGSTSVTVGAGGAAVSGWGVGNPGSPSSFGSYTADTSANANGNANGGGHGGSGGGGGGVVYDPVYSSRPASGGGTATSGLGNNGGSGSDYTIYYYGAAGGGGGGAGSAGSDAYLVVSNSNKAQGGNGGAGLAYSISGSSVYYGGGGGGGCNINGNGAGSGGSGGGGAGSQSNVTATSATANTGGGGGGGGSNGNTPATSGAGGSGIVIIRYPGTPVATGGTITQSGGYTIHTFTSSGTFVLSSDSIYVQDQSRTGNGTVTFTGTAPAGYTFDWYDASTGGTALQTGSSTFTTPSINDTTVYYVTARNTTTGCVSPQRTAVTAWVTSVPEIIVSGTLTRFTYCSGSSSDAKTFTVSGSGLSDPIGIKAPTGFEVSETSGSGYADSITLTSGSSTIPTTTIYVRVKSTATNAPSGNITISTTGVSSSTVAVYAATDNALNFDGTNDYVDCGKPTATRLTNNFTIGAWIKTSLAAQRTYLTNQWVYHSSGMLLGLTSAGKLHIAYTANSSGSWTSHDPDTVLSDGKWHYVVVSFESGRLRTYIDSVLVDNYQTAYSNVYYSGVPNLVIGKDGGSGLEFWNGSIDEVSIWSKVLSQSEVTSTMVSGITGSESNLVLYYDFNQGIAAGTNTGLDSLLDRSSNAIKGTLTNMALSGSTSNWVKGRLSEISGSSSVCATSTLQLANPLSGGSWSSSNTGIATVNSSTGLVSGVAAGSATITYDLCGRQVTQNVTVVVGTQLNLVAFKDSTICAGTSVTLVAASGNALNFSDTIALTIPHNSKFNFSTSFTFETWVKTTTTAEKYLTNKGNNSFYVCVNPPGSGGVGKVGFFLNSVRGSWLISNRSVNDGLWHHVATTYDGQYMKIYIDGRLSAFISGTASISTGTDPVYLGSRGGGYKFAGSMDEVRFWNTARTQSEITNNFHVVLPPNTTGLVAYYRLDESTGSTVADSSGNGLNGSIGGTPIRWLSPAQSPVSGNGLTGYSWSTGATTPYISVNPAGTTNYTVTATNTLGCTYSDTQNIYISGASSVIPSVTITSNDADNSICSGTSVTFTATPTNGGSTPLYQWFKNNIHVGENSSTYTSSSLANGDVMKVILMSTATCAVPDSAVSNTITTAVAEKVTPSVSIVSSDNDNTFCPGTSVTFTATPTNGGTPSYQWKLNGNNVGTNSATYTTSSLVNGDSVKVVMTSSIACVTAATATSNTIGNIVYTDPVPTAPSITAVGSTSFCAGDSVRLSVPSSLPIGSALVFSPASGSYLNCGNDAAFNFSGSFTLETWVNFNQVSNTSGSADWQSIFNKSGFYDSYGLMLNNSATATQTLRFYHNGLSSGSTSASVNFVPHRWYHIAVTYNSSTSTSAIYVNGELAVSASAIGTVSSNSNNLYVGYQTSGGTSYFLDGYLDETRIWDVARTQTEIRDNRFRSVNANSAGLVAYYKMDEASGTTVTNATGVTARNATLVNGSRTSTVTAPLYLLQWYLNGNEISGATDTSYTATAAGSYTLVISNSSGCSNTSAATTVTVTPLSSTSVSIVSNASYNTICSGTSVTFTATPTNGGTPTYQWKLNGNNVGTNSATYTTSNLADGDVVKVLMTSSLSCVTAATAESNSITTAVINAGSNAVWLGNTSAAWSTGSNWCSGSVPSSGASVTIPAGLTNYPVLSSDVSVADLELATGATLSLNGNELAVTGNLSGTGRFIGSSTSSFVYGGSGSSDTVYFATTTPGTTDALANLTYDRSGQTLTVGDTLNIYGVITPTAGTLNANGKLVLKSNASGTARIAAGSGNYITGEVTVERYLPDRNRTYRLLTPSVNTSGSIRANWMENGMNTSIGVNSNPVPGYGTQITGLSGNVNGFDLTGSNQPSLYVTTNGVDPTYTAVNSTSGTLNAKTGYFLFVRGDRSMDMTLNNTNVPPNPAPLPGSSTTLRAKGTLVTGTVNSFTNAFSSTANSLNLVTNPYASPISWASVYGASSNITQYYTLWDPSVGYRGGFVTVSTDGTKSVENGGTSSATNIIQPGQAFFVQSTGTGTPVVVIEEAHKTSGNNNAVFAPVSLPKASLQASIYYKEASGYRRLSDGVLSQMDPGYSNAVNSGDAMEITNWDENLAILQAGKRLSIEQRNIPTASDTLNLFISNMKRMTYELEVKTQGMADASLQPYLVDRFTGAQTLLKNNESTIVPFSVTSNSASSASGRFYVIFKNTGTLPVRIVQFKASAKGKAVQVNWQVEEDESVDHYEVERSKDQSAFNKIGVQMASGKNLASAQYSLLDNDPFTGNNFYRLKLVEKSGDIKYSKVERVIFSGRPWSVSVFPNPFSGTELQVRLEQWSAGNYRISITDVLGRVVYNRTIETQGGNLAIPIGLKGDMSSIKSGTGVYWLKIEGEGVVWKSLVLSQ